jgi:release factor glutamine methyltransferase
MPSDIVSTLRTAGCVFAEDEAALLVAAAAGDSDRLAELVARRVAGEPLEHVLGWVEFCGLRIAVEPGVFVPRRRTEFLVRQAVSVTSPGAVVVDLCCGCGALGTALAAAVPVELYAADVEPAAVRCARRNVPGEVFEGDLFEALPAALRGRVAILLANVPYVPTGKIGTMPPEARLHEPHVALDGGADGLDVLRRVAGEARQWLAPGGHLFVETSEGQAPQARDAFVAAGLAAQVLSDEDSGATVVRGTCGPSGTDPLPR